MKNLCFFNIILILFIASCSSYIAKNQVDRNIFNKEIRDILEGIARNQMVLIEEIKNLNKNIQQNMERNKKINTVESKVTGIVQKYDAI